jgi:hypothetical protein
MVLMTLRHVSSYLQPRGQTPHTVAARHLRQKRTALVIRAPIPKVDGELAISASITLDECSNRNVLAAGSAIVFAHIVHFLAFRYDFSLAGGSDIGGRRMLSKRT